MFFIEGFVGLGETHWKKTT